MPNSPRLSHFLLSDLHLGHENVLKYTRPQFSSIQEHDDFIINRINETCGPNDYLWILGDVALNREGLGRVAEIKCHKGLILGNHDTFKYQEYERFFHRVKHMTQINSEDYGRILFTHIPIHASESRWTFNIHGHKHNELIDSFRFINVSCEVMDFRPQRISDLLFEHCRRMVS